MSYECAKPDSPPSSGSRRRRWVWTVCVLLGGLTVSATAGQALERQPNTTLRMPAQVGGSAQYQYRVVEAFPGLKFEKPVFATAPDGETQRLYVVERAGRIVVVNDLGNPSVSLYLDLTDRVASDWDTGKVEGLSSVAFHPAYLTSRFPKVFVTYTMRADGPEGPSNFNRLSRFQSTRADPSRASAESEAPLITQLDRGDGHNFNNAVFGPDGYLYVSIGDEGDGGKGDDFNNAQHIDRNFFSGILRLDVDQLPGSVPPNPHPAVNGNYAVPADNPWVGATSFNGAALEPQNVRTEFYAVGLRNPWRMAFDPVTGYLYEGDVGQHGREEINIIVKGGNYGWSIREGTLDGPKAPAPPGVSLINPIHEYSPGYGADQGFSVTGGRVYRGPSLPELVGAYIFADYVTGNIWALRYDGVRATEFVRLAGQTGIAGFAVDPRDGELLLIDHDRGQLLKLERSVPTQSGALPETLADTGAFLDLQSLTPQSGIIPYEVNLPFWSDGAHKKRWFSIPDPSRGIQFNPQDSWQFPAGAIWIKHFELTNAAPTPRRLETRVLVKTSNGVYGVTYRWGESTNNAVLVPEDGLDETILVRDAGIVRTQLWHYPSRSECLACHTPAAGYALGFHTPQLNRDVDLDGIVTNQILALAAAGYITNGVSNVFSSPALASMADASVSREYRVRSYLAANCAPCHQPSGPAHALWDARLSTPLFKAGIVDGHLFETRGDTNQRVVKAGSPAHSMLLTRISELGRDRMPPIGSSVVDTQAIALLTDWIVQDLPNSTSYAAWQRAFFGSTSNPAAALDADPDLDGAPNYLEYLVGRNPNENLDSWGVSIKKAADGVEILFPQASNRLFQVQFAPGIQTSNQWLPLDVPDNRPLPASTNRLAVVRDARTNDAARVYRVTVREP